MSSGASPIATLNRKVIWLASYPKTRRQSEQGVDELTVSSSQVACVVHELDLLLVQACQSSQILVFAIFREGVNALVAVMEMRKQNVGPFSRLKSASASITKRVASYLDDIL